MLPVDLPGALCLNPYSPERITLEIMTLQPRCEDVETAEGVAITVTGVAQVTPFDIT